MPREAAAIRGRLLIRTPDDPDGWTASADIVPGTSYQYISGDVAVILDWPDPRRPRPVRDPRRAGPRVIEATE